MKKYFLKVKNKILLYRYVGMVYILQSSNMMNNKCFKIFIQNNVLPHNVSKNIHATTYAQGKYM